MPPSAPSRPTPPPRLASLDALRGFDMFWILGMEAVAWELGKLAPWCRPLTDQLGHVDWSGFNFLDLVFPLFVFISGASLAFSLSRSLETIGRPAALRRLALRALLLYALGLLSYHGLAEGWSSIRWVGVLQRIAICNLAAGLLFCFLSGRARLAVAAALLLGYWLLLRFVGPPDGVAADYMEGPQHNLANWLDFHYLPGRRWDKTHDPEGLLSTLPAIATALIGVQAGDYLRRAADPPARKAAILLGVGAAMAAAGWLWAVDFPVIKKLWTSSFVLVAGGYSLMLLAAFYWLIDARRPAAPSAPAPPPPAAPLWARPWIWIGMNPITLYMMERVVRIEDIVKSVIGGPIADATGAFAPLWLALGVVAFNLLIAWWLYRRQIFLKV